MFQKIKIEKLNKKRFLILFLIFIGLFVVAEPGSAFVFDPAKAAMSGLAELGGQLFAIFVAFFVALFSSHWLVELSSRLLDWAMTLPVNLMADNELVEAGWTFIRDLVNLFFALALVAIAMAFILKIESFEIKKSLPRLIIIALLVNFSLLLVGAFIDIATILQNTIIGGAQMAELVHNTTKPLYNVWTEASKAVVGIIIAWTITAAIPYADAVRFIAQALLLTAFLPNFFHWILIIVFNTLIGLIFFLFFFLFLIRIIALWILAIFAPLALMAYILPITQKYFHSWLKAVISWAFLGIIALFLLTLGLRLIHAVMPAREEGLAGLILPWGLHDFAEFVIYYFFLLTFLTIAFLVSLKTAPTGAEVAINYAKSAIGGIAKVGIGTALGHKLAGIEGGIGKRLGAFGERGIEHGEKLLFDETGKKKGWGSRARGTVEQILSRPLARAGYAMQEHAQRQKAEEHENLEKKYKGLSSDQIIHDIENTTDKDKLAALWSVAAKDAGHIAKINEVIGDGNTYKELKQADSDKWKQMSPSDKKKAEEKIVKADILTKSLYAGYGKNLGADRIDSGNYKKIQNAFAPHLVGFEKTKQFEKLPENVKAEAKMDDKKVGTIFNRLKADPTVAEQVNIRAMASSKELGEATRQQVLKLDSSALRSFEKTPILMNDILVVLRQILRASEEEGGYGGDFGKFKKEHPDMADFYKGTAGYALAEEFEKQKNKKRKK